MRTARKRALADLAVGTAAAVAVFAAVPVVLVAVAGLPIPRHLDRSSLMSARGLLDALALVSWAAWITCCLPVLRSVVERVRVGDPRAPAGCRPRERLAACIAAAVLVVVPVPAVAGAAAPHRAPVAAGALHPPATEAHAAPWGPGGPPVGGPAGPATPGVGGTGVAVPASSPDAARYVVEPGDSLWSIADRLYGDGSDWQALARLNEGRVMDDGTRFVDPSLIRPGWQLLLPGGPDWLPAAEAATEAGARREAPPPGRLGPEPSAAGPSAAVHVAVSSSPARHARSGPTPRGAHRQRAEPPSPDGRGHHAAPLPELAILGVGTVMAAALSRRARRAQQLQSLRWASARSEQAVPGWEPASQRLAGRSGAEEEEEEEEEDAATLLHRVGPAPVLDWLELANRHLASELLVAEGAPAIRLLRVGADGVDAWLAEPARWAPPHWRLLERGRIWHLPASVDPDQLAGRCRGNGAWLPLVVPVGDDERGTWLAVLEPGTCLPVIGSEAPAFVDTMALAAESWPWSDRVVVTTDPSRAAREVALGAGGDGAERAGVLYVGDPSPLPASVLSRCGVLTTLPLPATDLTVAVCPRAATIHPLGVVVRPHVLAPRLAPAVVGLVTRPAAGGGSTTPWPNPGLQPTGPGRDISTGPGPGTREHTSGPAPEAHLGASGPAPEAHLGARASDLVPGRVEVRLLTPVPRIEGLSGELEPKRARRAVELVAYLALHHPDPVTSDRLRTRVLGSSEADAAAKTLFNVAAAARRAMGTDPEGSPYLPPASRTGHYRVSAGVTVDVARAASLVAAARRVEEPDRALALLRAALDLVEGEPLATALSGYAWWQAEGHAGRIGALLVDAACELCQLAIDRGHLELAGWALERARLVEPYSEALTRAAMRWAAARGDTDRLRREWRECQRWVDELEPGAVPGAETEQLYAELAARATTTPAGPGAQASLAAIDAAPRSTVPSAPSDE